MGLVQPHGLGQHGSSMPEEQGSSGLASPCSAKGSNMHPPQLQQHSEAWDFLKCCEVKFCTKSQLTTAASCPGCAQH